VFQRISSRSPLFVLACLFALCCTRRTPAGKIGVTGGAAGTPSIVSEGGSVANLGGTASIALGGETGFIDTFDPGNCTQPAHKPDCANGWCRVPAGCFVMGSPENEWGHAPVEEARVAVTLTRPFEIMQHEVTQREWVATGSANPSGRLPNGQGDCLEPDCPVANVNWFEAVWYANFLSEHAVPSLPACYRLANCRGAPGLGVGPGLVCDTVTTPGPTVYECQGYRLPSDAEWEYAARAGTKTAFYSGDITRYADKYVCNPDKNLEKIAWYCFNSGGLTHQVGLLTPNQLGLYDMAGNADEWVNDASDGRPATVPIDPDGRVTDAISRNVRSGSALVWAIAFRSAKQDETSRYDRSVQLGFRLVRTLP